MAFFLTVAWSEYVKIISEFLNDYAHKEAYLFVSLDGFSTQSLSSLKFRVCFAKSKLRVKLNQINWSQMCVFDEWGNMENPRKRHNQIQCSVNLPVWSSCKNRVSN